MRLCSTTAGLRTPALTTLDFAKAMIDEGYHPMTVYFPLIVHGAMLIEPTEIESKASLDLFIMTLRDLAHAPRRQASASASSRRPSLRRAGGSTRPAPRGSRCCAGQDLSLFKGDIFPMTGLKALDCRRTIAPLAPKD